MLNMHVETPYRGLRADLILTFNILNDIVDIEKA